jgi:hypothetical protein
MENIYRDGYVTEKIVIAFLGGCIPIYFGSQNVFDVFHKNAFIYYDVENPESVGIETSRILGKLQNSI